MKKKSLMTRNKKLRVALRQARLDFNAALAQARRYQKALSAAGIILPFVPEDFIL